MGEIWRAIRGQDKDKFKKGPTDAEIDAVPLDGEIVVNGVPMVKRGSSEVFPQTHVGPGETEQSPRRPNGPQVSYAKDDKV